MEVRAIDYFNPPICESLILVALRSTGESLMGLSAACLRPLPVQLTFSWNLPGERAGGWGQARHGAAASCCSVPSLTKCLKSGVTHTRFLAHIFYFLWLTMKFFTYIVNVIIVTLNILTSWFTIGLVKWIMTNIIMSLYLKSDLWQWSYKITKKD